jgi:hypothetical protein
LQHWSNLGQEPPSEDRILQLYPLPGGEVQLKGLYLGHALRTVVQDRGSPFVYANLIASLDGRIALPSPEGPGLATPNAIANPRDRLVTIMIAPLMTCSARLPVYALLIGALIPA